MQGRTFYNFYFLLATLLIFVAGCAKGTLEVKSEPSGAKVWIDGKDAGKTPYSGSVVAGEEHNVIVSAEGYKFKSQKVTVRTGGKEVVSAILEEVKAGVEEIIGKDGAVMRLIPAGEFIMGSPEGEGDNGEHPQHTVFLDAFYIDKYEVTNAQYKQFMDATGCSAPAYWNDEKYNQPNQPVVGVSWDDAVAYAKWAGKRLPTEAEWEKAARGGLVGKRYPWGDEISHNDANYSGTGGKDTWNGPAPVGSFAPNGYGLYDMAGNVWEWCADWYDSNYYSRSPQQNPKGPGSGSWRALRGGSWYHDPCYLRCDSAASTRRRSGYNYVGFRCAQNILWLYSQMPESMCLLVLLAITSSVRLELPRCQGRPQGFSLRSGCYPLTSFTLLSLSTF